MQPSYSAKVSLNNGTDLELNDIISEGVNQDAPLSPSKFFLLTNKTSYEIPMHSIMLIEYSASRQNFFEYYRKIDENKE